MKRKLLMVAVCGVIGVLQTQARADWTYAAGYYWEYYNSKYYALTETGNGATWDGVRQEALDLGGDLVTIDDAAENSWLADTMFGSPDYQNLPGYDAIDHLWIGLSQDPGAEEPSGGWTWVDGSAVGYSNWGSNQTDVEPNNARGAENWAAIRADALSTWNDYNPTAWLDRGYDGIQGIIELDELPSTPAPSAVLLAAIGSTCVSFLRRRTTL